MRNDHHPRGTNGRKLRRNNRNILHHHPLRTVSDPCICITESFHHAQTFQGIRFALLWCFSCSRITQDQMTIDRDRYVATYHALLQHPSSRWTYSDHHLAGTGYPFGKVSRISRYSSSVSRSPVFWPLSARIPGLNHHKTLIVNDRL